jgi:hypothetical protein
MPCPDSNRLPVWSTRFLSAGLMDSLKMERQTKSGVNLLHPGTDSNLHDYTVRYTVRQ